MFAEVFAALALNAALLLALAMVFDGVMPLKAGLRVYSTGIIVGIVGVLLMMTHWQMEQGIIFDARSVALVVSGLFLGLEPTAIAAVIMGAFRIHMGGAAVFTGLAVIVSSATVGVAWRWARRGTLVDIQWRELFAMGLVAHVVMLAMMLTMGPAVGLHVLSHVAGPVLALFPAATAALGLVVVKRLRHKRDVDALRISESHVRALFEQVTVGVAEVDSDTGFHVRMNRSYCELVGYTAEELVTIDCRTLVSEQDAPAALAGLKGIQNGVDGEMGMELRCRRKDGTVRWVLVNASRLWTEEGEPKRYMMVVHDTTERRRHLQALRDLTSELSLAEERERRRLAGDLHDDVCQLMTLAQMKLSMARQGILGQADAIAETEGLVARANRSARSLMLQMSHPAIYDLGLVAGAKWLADDIRRLYGLDVHVSDEAGQPKIELKLRVMLYQCLRELLVNAAKHSGSRLVSVRIGQDEQDVKIEVKDDGRGMDAKRVTPMSGGAGFGLFAIRERVRNMEGRMDICSEPGKGTIVTLTVPLRESEGDPVTQDPNHQSGELPSR